jgi:hypothetical protein
MMTETCQCSPIAIPNENMGMSSRICNCDILLLLMLMLLLLLADKVLKDLLIHFLDKGIITIVDNKPIPESNVHPLITLWKFGMNLMEQR